MYAIETTDLTKVFNRCKAVDGLDLKVPMGSIYGFLGPNGAGKTTTIKMLTGLSRPTSGQIRICGNAVKFGSLKNRENIGYLPDVPCFYNWMRPEEFLRFSGELFNMGGKELNERVKRLLELVGLMGIKKNIGSFSRGMKQRLGIAQALINDPKVVFLDEPTSALDPIGRKEIMDIIFKLSGKVTVFFSTHVLSDIERVCDRVIILNEGKVMIEDSLENLRQKYSMHTFVLETENEADAARAREALIHQDWTGGVEIGEGNEVRIIVKKMKEAQLNITGILYENNIPLRKFNLMEPSLEDIFLKVVNN